MENILTGEEFSKPAHELIFATMKGLQEEGNAVNLVSVTEQLYRTGRIDTAGGPGYLASLEDNIGSASQAEYYAKVVR